MNTHYGFRFIRKHRRFEISNIIIVRTSIITIIKNVKIMAEINQPFLLQAIVSYFSYFIIAEVVVVPDEFVKSAVTLNDAIIDHFANFG